LRLVSYDMDRRKVSARHATNHCTTVSSVMSEVTYDPDQQMPP